MTRRNILPTNLRPLPEPRPTLLGTPAERLLHFGLMQPPSPVSQPASHAFWKKLFSKSQDSAGESASWEARQFDNRTGISIQTEPTKPKRKFVALRETSRNWSGAYITPRGGRTFRGICGAWQVPAITLPNFPGQARTDATYSSSIWIGLDGQRRYLHSSLPQIGTAQKIVVKDNQCVVSYTAWWEWWCAGFKSEPQVLDVHVSAGDRVRCAMTVDSPTEVTFFFRNENTNIDHAFHVNSPTVPVDPDSPNGPKVQLEVSGATAQWIVERPSDPNTVERFHLANYKEVLFTDCVATATRSLDGGGSIDQMLEGATLIDMIDMIDMSGNRRRMAPISAASRGDDMRSVRTVYTGDQRLAAHNHIL